MSSNTLVKGDFGYNKANTPQQLDLFTNNEWISENNVSILNCKEKTSKSVESLLKIKNDIFYESSIVNFSNLEIKKSNNIININFTISLNEEPNSKLLIEIDINTLEKFNNIVIRHSDMTSIKMRFEVLKYFVTKEWFHKLMSEILKLEYIPDELKDITYHHQKHWSLKDYIESEEIKYRGEKLILWKIWLSSNHFPDLFLLKDNCEVKIKNKKFNFVIEFEIDNKVYKVTWNWLRTEDYSWNGREKVVNILINNFNLETSNDFSNETLNQLERYINYYIAKL
jgi:hypothetical protein